MTSDKFPHSRIKIAFQTYAMNKGGKLNHTEIGAAVAHSEGRREPYHPDTVFAWMSGEEVPSFATLNAIAKLVGWHEDEMQLGFLAYGDELSIHGLNEEDYNRYHFRNSSRTTKRAP